MPCSTAKKESCNDLDGGRRSCESKGREFAETKKKKKKKKKKKNLALSQSGSPIQAVLGSG